MPCEFPMDPASPNLFLYDHGAGHLPMVRDNGPSGELQLAVSYCCCCCRVHCCNQCYVKVNNNSDDCALDPCTPIPMTPVTRGIQGSAGGSQICNFCAIYNFDDPEIPDACWKQIDESYHCQICDQLELASTCPYAWKSRCIWQFPVEFHYPCKCSWLWIPGPVKSPGCCSGAWSKATSICPPDPPNCMLVKRRTTDGSCKENVFCPGPYCEDSCPPPSPCRNGCGCPPDPCSTQSDYWWNSYTCGPMHMEVIHNPQNNDCTDKTSCGWTNKPRWNLTDVTNYPCVFTFGGGTTIEWGTGTPDPGTPTGTCTSAIASGTVFIGPETGSFRYIVTFNLKDACCCPYCVACDGVGCKAGTCGVVGLASSEAGSVVPVLTRSLPFSEEQQL